MEKFRQDRVSRVPAYRGMTVAEARDWALPALQARSQEKRDQLVNAGLRLIEDVPYARLTVSEIAREAGYGVGTFYRRFPDRQHFLFALQELANREFLLRLETEVPEPATPAETVSAENGGDKLDHGSGGFSCRGRSKTLPPVAFDLFGDGRREDVHRGYLLTSSACLSC